MQRSLDTRRESTSSYSPLADRQVLLAEALLCCISGRALPETLRRPAREVARPASTEAGIQRILAGPLVS
jgi:hypothetical protein